MRGPILADFLASAGPVLAGDGWTVLTGADIGTARSARLLVYEGGATQPFNADGSTDYESGSVGHGRWRVDGDHYCSDWAVRPLGLLRG